MSDRRYNSNKDINSNIRKPINDLFVQMSRLSRCESLLLFVEARQKLVEVTVIAWFVSPVRGENP